MILFAWYIAKVILCSAILYGYYLLALKDKIFHRWNRFYLLSATAISILLPFVSIDILSNHATQGTAINLIRAVTAQDEIVIELGKKTLFNSTTLIAIGYLIISFFLLTMLLITFLKIIRLKNIYPNTKIDGIDFINTEAKGTPFSFFSYLFWNQKIDLHSPIGQKIFNHEIAHIKEKHTHDKIFLNVVQIFFWANPVFWLMRKELNMIHEFIADKIAVEDGDISAFSEMILKSIYPTQNFSIANNFFYSPIKRRLKMLTKNTNPKVNYLSRLLVLPLAAIIFLAFSLKIKSEKANTIYTGGTITVVVDAGHGGQDNGAKYNDILEKDITLKIVNEIKALNANKKINILLSREGDKAVSLNDRVSFADENKATLFISVHLNAGTEPTVKSGMDVIVQNNGNNYHVQSNLLASSMIDAFKKDYPLPVAPSVYERQQGVFVLKNNQRPSVIVQPAFMTTEKDQAFLDQPENIKLIASNILKGIENYAEQIINLKMIPQQAIVDTPPLPKMMYKGKRVVRLELSTKQNKVKVDYNDKSTEIITKEEADKRGFILPPPPPPPLPPPPPPPAPSPNSKTVPSLSGTPSPAALTESLNKLSHSYSLYFLNGKESSKNEIEKINPNDIKSVSIYKAKGAIEKYGPRGADGVLEIWTIKNTAEKNNEMTVTGQPIPPVSGVPTSNDGNNSNANTPVQVTGEKIFTKVEEEASFPGGFIAWKKYISGFLAASSNELTSNDEGTCIVRFIVNTDGSISNVQPETMKNSKLAEVSVNAISNGPKWIPARQNGQIVKAYRIQPITLSLPESK